MKKRITVFILMLVMLVGVFGSISVYASEIDFSSAEFDSVCSRTMGTFVNEDDEESAALVYADFVINSISVDDYGVYGVSNLKYNGCIYYFVCADSAFDVEFISNYIYSGFEYMSIFDSYGLSASDTMSNTYHKTETKTLSSSYRSGVYFACLGWSEVFAMSDSVFSDKSCSGSGYVFSMTSEEFESISGSGQANKTAYYLIDNILSVYGDDVSQAPNVSIDEYTGPDFDESTATYERELGYLQNVQFKSLYLKFWDELLNKFSTNPDTGQYRISWGSTSTSGVSLSDEDIYVRMYSQCAIYNKEHENICNNFPKNYIGRYSASSGSLTIDIADFLSYSQAQFDEVYNSMSIVQWTFNECKRCDNIYLQLIRKNDDGSWSYGGYLKLSNNDDGSVSAQPIAPDGGVDIDGGGKQPVDSTTGIGDSYEDALEDANQSINVNDDLIENAENLVSQIGEIPQLIAELFSFLPSWCLTLFGVGFGIIVLLIIYKLIRG